MTSTDNTQEPDVEETLARTVKLSFPKEIAPHAAIDLSEAIEAINQLILKAKIDEASRHSDTYYVNKDGRLKKEYKADRIAELNSKLEKGE